VVDPVTTVQIVPYSIPFERPITLGKVALERRTGWYLRLEDGAGNVGWGEAAPLPGFSRETGACSLSDLEFMADRIRSGETEVPENVCSSARFAVELAVANLEARLLGIPVARVLRPDARLVQSVNAILLSNESPERAAAAVRSGFRAVKMKVGGQSVEDDAERVRMVAAALAGRATLRLDANRAWDREQAELFATLVSDVDIEYIEEPLSSPGELPLLARKTGLPIALDESLAVPGGEAAPGGETAPGIGIGAAPGGETAPGIGIGAVPGGETAPGIGIGAVPEERPQAEADWSWLAAVVLKPTIIGGIARTRLLAGKALAAGVTPVISSALETDIGLYGLSALAASLGEVDTPAGLDTSRFLKVPSTRPAFSPRAGSVRTGGREAYTVVVAHA
jgi:o-succinylbenzoate synthase